MMKPLCGGGVSWETKTAPPGSGPGVTPPISAISPLADSARGEPNGRARTSGAGWRTHVSPARLNADTVAVDEHESYMYLPQSSSARPPTSAVAPSPDSASTSPNALGAPLLLRSPAYGVNGVAAWLQPDAVFVKSRAWLCA